MTKRVKIVVFGRVQGVFFRFNTQKKAVSLDLSGWVKNQDDGTVEIIAEGEEEKLKSLVSWTRTGPPGTRVDKVETEWSSSQNKDLGFLIK